MIFDMLGLSHKGDPDKPTLPDHLQLHKLDLALIQVHDHEWEFIPKYQIFSR